MSASRWTVAAAAALAVALVMPALGAAQGRSKSHAGELAAQAREAFGSKNYLQAAELLSQAFDYYPEPNFVWNTARAYELAGEVERAEAAYLRFAALDVAQEERVTANDKAARLRAWRTLPTMVRSAQDGAEMVALRSRVSLLEGRVADGGGGTSGAAISPLAIGGWSAAGAGIVALGAVLTLHLASVSTVEEYHDTAASGQDRGKYDALKDTLQTRVVVSQVLGVSGALLLATGGTLLYFEYFGGSSPDASSSATQPASGFRVGPWVSPDTAGVSIGGAF